MHLQANDRLELEYQLLREKLFTRGNLVKYDDNDPRWVRYFQLLGHVAPEMRADDWVSPLN